MMPMPDPGDHPARVLIVDDDPHNRDLLEVMLAADGFELRMAVSGEEALAQIAEHPPDLILLDVMMPGLNGYQVAATLKSSAATKNIPIIMITALENRDARLPGLSAGAEDFLTRPVDRAELRVRIRNLLRLRAYGEYYDKYSQLLEADVASRTADLVERTKAVEQQAAVLAEQAALLELAQDAIVVTDMRHRILFWSHGAEVMYGWSRNEAVGKAADDVLHPESADSGAQAEATLLRDGRWDGEAVHLRRDGARLAVASRWTLQRSADGIPAAVLTITNDITSRKQAETERRLLTERLSLATAVAKVGVWAWDLATDTLTWDATMFEIYGFAPVAVLPARRWSTAVHPDDLERVEATFRTAVADKTDGSAEFRIVRADGSIRDVSSVARAVIDDHGRPTRLIGVQMDITKRKDAEKALEQSRQEQLRFKDDFLSHVSHELRSPLTAIKQFTTILLGGMAGALNEDQRHYSGIMLKNIQQLQSMIDDLLEVTRLETGKLTIEPEYVSIADAVTDVLETLQITAAAKGITLSCDVASDLPAAYADMIRVRQILIILIDNAIKFTPEGGAVGVRATVKAVDPRFLKVEVSDTGCGVSPAVAEKIFDRLYQAQSSDSSRTGLGLGLYICKELVVRQGGRIWATPRRPHGSVFSFTIPVFSLCNVIAPLVKNDAWPAQSVAMITVEACVGHTWPSRVARDEWSHEARILVQRCLMPNLDVLLPNLRPSSNGFYVAAFADERGASVLADRIRGQLERHRHLKQTGPKTSVSYTMLQAPAPVAGATVESMVARMAASLEHWLTSQFASEGAA